MRTTTIRFLDYWLGVPACAFLTLLRRPVELRRFGRASRAAPPSRVLFLKFIEQGATVLAQDAIASRGARGGTRQRVLLRVRKQSRHPRRARDGAAAKHPRRSAIARCSPFLADFLRAAWFVRSHRIDSVIDMEFFSRASAIFAFLSGAANRVGLHRFTGELPYRGDLMTHRVQYLPHLHISVQYSDPGRGAVRHSTDPARCADARSSEPLLKVPLERDSRRRGWASRRASFLVRRSSNACARASARRRPADRHPQSQRQRPAAAAQVADGAIRGAGRARPRGLPGRADRADRRAIGARRGGSAVPRARLAARGLGGRRNFAARAADALQPRRRARHQRQRPRPLRVADARARDRAVRSGNAAAVRPAVVIVNRDLEGAGLQSVRERVQSPALAVHATTSACSRLRWTKCSTPSTAAVASSDLSPKSSPARTAS